MPNDDDEASSPKPRWVFTNDVLAAVLVVALTIMTATYVYRGQSVPLWLATVMSVGGLTAVAWTFGKGQLKAARKVLGKKEE